MEARAPVVRVASIRLGRVVSRPRVAWLGLAAVWAVSRLIYAAAGIRFDRRMIGTADQVVDLGWLRTDYWRTLWYTHSQPPLFNAVVGGIEHLPSGMRGATYWLLASSVSVLTAIAVCQIGRRLGLAPGVAWTIAAVLCIRPDAVLYEQWFFYTHFEVMLLVATILAIGRWAVAPDDGAKWRAALVAGVAFTGLGMMRSLFHLAFVLVIVIVVGLVSKDGVVRAARLAAVPLVLGLALYAKNYAMFDSFGPSTWQGENLARITLGRLSPHELDRLIADRVVSPNARFLPFAVGYTPPPGTPRSELGPEVRVAVLDHRTKDSTGATNYNWRGYLPLFRAHLADSLAFIRHDPGRWVSEMRLSWERFFNSPGDNIRLLPNSGRISGFRRAVDAVSGQVHAGGSELSLETYTHGIRSVEWGWILGWAVAVIGPGSISVHRRRLERSPVPVDAATIGQGIDPVLHWAMWAAIVYVSVIGNAFEQGENNRFRFVIDPLIVLGAAATCTYWARVSRARRDAADPNDVTEPIDVAGAVDD